MTTSLKNKVIVITGASSGIGKSIADLLADHDVHLILIGRNEGKLRQIGAAAGKKADVTCKVADLADGLQLKQLISDFKAENIAPDVLIHCAGNFHYASVLKTTDAIIEESFQVNFKAPFILTRDLLEKIIQKKGQIIFINSTAGLAPKSNVAAYSSFKGALRIFADILHQEVFQFGVRVTSIFPGRVDTPMQQQVCAMEGKEYTPEHYIRPEDMARTILEILTLPVDVEINELTIRPNSFAKIK
jgi:short-subunit dehydrogenase